MKITILAGGVGGAKLVDGLAKILPVDALTIVVNTGDDFEYLGLNISPDLDTICYTLAGLANPVTGWGRKDETWVTYEALSAMDGEDLFRIGDRDLATHLYRTGALIEGKRLSDVTRDMCAVWGIQHSVYPMSDDPVRTIVITKAGEPLCFQEYFVHQGCQPEVQSFEFKGSEMASPLADALKAIDDSDLIVVAPSNPWVSIDPILAVPGYIEAIKNKPVIAVSPLIGGRALKGPAAKMYWELGIQPTAAAVADHYRPFLTGFVFDTEDRDELEKIQGWRIIPFVTDVVMKNHQDRIQLAQEVLEFGQAILTRSR